MSIFYSRTPDDAATAAGAKTVRRPLWSVCLGALCVPAVLLAGTATLRLSGVGGGVDIPIFYDDPGGGPPLPPPPAEPPTRPPAIFSAPLPSGSGARALGLAGAFTAVADDATAASWNPAGLLQLERAELSVVYRLSRERDARHSDDDGWHLGTDGFNADAINYLSAALPFRLLDRNLVASLNYQEVYDFSHRYRARTRESGVRDLGTATYTDPDFVPITCDPAVYRQTDAAHATDLFFTPELAIRRTFTQQSSLSYTALTDLSFEQEGAVQAVTPALAFEVTPRLSLGAAFNVYQAGLLDASPIRSRTRASYAGTLDQSVLTAIDSIDYDGTVTIDGTWNGWPIHIDDLPVSWTDDAPDDPDSLSTTRYRYRGLYQADDRMSSFRGVNATLGSLYTVSEHLTLGISLDLPWTARARQTQTVLTQFELLDENGASLGQTASSTRSQHKIAIDFPLHWALGAAWRWNDRLTSSLDVGQTQWSRFSYRVRGEPRTNPLDGSRYGENPINDCWAVRTGVEYLWVLAATEIPFRAGLSWEQRPALDEPDTYWGISLGSGFSVGTGANKVIIDVAYTFTWGQDVMGSLVPDQAGRMGSDVARHDVFVSCIYHF